MRPGNINAGAALTARGISKKFPGVLALDNVQLTVRRGEVQALMGENGAGKSTLIKILTGVYPRDGGTIHLDGAPIEPRNPQGAQALGISTVYQEVNLIPHLSVAENICLGRQPRRWGFLDWRKMARRAEAALRRFGLALDVRRSVASFSIAIQQMVAIARALDFNAKILILDEPTSSLDAREVEQLFTVLRQLKGEGLGIVFISHFLNQIYAIADRITVLRNGQFAGEFLAAELPRLELIARMLGKSPAEAEALVARGAPSRESKTASPFLEARGLGRKNSLAPTDFAIGRGEVLGLAGLLGSGRTEMARLLFGVDRADHGEVRLEGKPIVLHGPRAAIAFGIGFCPEDRKVEAIIPNLSVRENIALAFQARKGWFRAFSKKEQRSLADRFIQRLRIVTPDAEQPIKLLSGGNQQKVILGRWLASEPRLLILDEPNRGVDVGAKFEIEGVIRGLAEGGMAVLFISSEWEELIRNCGRLLVLRDRTKVAELEGAAVTESAIMQAIAASPTPPGAS